MPTFQEDAIFSKKKYQPSSIFQLTYPQQKTFATLFHHHLSHPVRPEVWDEFQDKFNIPVVVEFLARWVNLEFSPKPFHRLGFPPNWWLK